MCREAFWLIVLISTYIGGSCIGIFFVRVFEGRIGDQHGATCLVLTWPFSLPLGLLFSPILIADWLGEKVRERRNG